MTDKKLSDLTAATGATGGDSLLLVQGGVSKQVTVDVLATTMAGVGATGAAGATGSPGTNGATGAAGGTGGTGATGANGSAGAILTEGSAGFGTTTNLTGFTQFQFTLHDSDSSFGVDMPDGAICYIIIIQDSTGGWDCSISAQSLSGLDLTIATGPNQRTVFTCLGIGGGSVLIIAVAKDT